MNINGYKQYHTIYDVENKLYVISNRKVINKLMSNTTNQHVYHNACNVEMHDKYNIKNVHIKSLTERKNNDNNCNTSKTK